MKVIPPKLKSAILGGRCVAFVGAGFARSVVPTWSELLRSLASSLAPGLTIADNASALELEGIGQLLKDAAEATGQVGVWKDAVRRALDESARDKPREQLDRRVEWLLRIPFKAILTTNFDPFLRGAKPGRDAYWQVLRVDQREGWQLPTALGDDWHEPPILKLHGDVEGPIGDDLVFSRSDYRNLVYQDGNYANFLRAVFAGYTLLFLGVSFTDAYLNELRSEMLSLLHTPGREGDPWGYAIQIGKQPEIIEFFERYESIVTLEAQDGEEFDAWLQGICRATSVEGRLGALLCEKTVVWVDSRPSNNLRGRELLEACGATVVSLQSEEELHDEHAAADLLLTQFGYDGPNGNPRAFRALERVSRWPSRPPVIVFAAPSRPHDDVAPQWLAQNRRDSLRRGAFEYATEWSELYRVIESLFGRSPGNARL